MSILDKIEKTIKEDDLPRTHGTLPTTGDQFPYQSISQINDARPVDRKLWDAFARMASFVSESRKLPTEKKIELLDYFRSWALKLDLSDYLKSKV